MAQTGDYIQTKHTAAAILQAPELRCSSSSLTLSSPLSAKTFLSRNSDSSSTLALVRPGPSRCRSRVVDTVQGEG